jgi:hypothetical protein
MLKLTGVAAMALSFIMMLVLTGCDTGDDSGGGGGGGTVPGGVSWTAVSDSTFGNAATRILGIAWGGASGSQKFVAVGDYGTMATSPDGTTWTAVTDSQIASTG